MFYTLIGLLYGLSLNFYLKKQEKALYTNSAVLLGVILWAGYQHGINFYSANYFCHIRAI